MRAHEAAARVAAAGAAALVLVALGIGTGAGYAVPPLDQVESLVDDAGVLSPGEEGRIQDDIAQLAARQEVALHVVFVGTFDGQSGPDWTEATFDRAGLARATCSSPRRSTSVPRGQSQQIARPVTADRAASHSQRAWKRCWVVSRPNCTRSMTASSPSPMSNSTSVRSRAGKSEST